MPSRATPGATLLADVSCTLAGHGWASDYAALLLGSLGAAVRRDDGPADAHPAIAWAQSWAMALTGRADGSPQMCPLPLASCVDGVAMAIAALVAASGNRLHGTLPDAATLGERAALSNLSRQGAISAGGACHLLRAADGWLAISLPRADDWELLPAWLETDFVAPEGATASAWEALAALLSGRSAAPLVARAQLLGLAAACADGVAAMPVAWCSAVQIASPLPRGERGWGEGGNSRSVTTRTALSPGPSPAPQGFPSVTSGRGEITPLVVDLSSLWAGPLCSHLLQLAGARVVKVESRQRPDGARRGAAAFYDLLNHGKASVALDFADPRGIAQLRALLLRADIVIEASRPRALRQLGICAEDILTANPRLTWLAISGHGRAEPQAEWIAYGDDAGVAAGLSGTLLELSGTPLFCGDAIADPLTGWHAALAALAGYYSGGGRLLSLALVDVVRHCAQFGLPADSAALEARWQEWQHIAASIDAVLPPPRSAAGPARALGADTAAILAEFDIPC